MGVGYFGLVLHGHMPYVKKSGVWPAGEENLFEAMYETYIPMLNALRELKENGIKTAITINITPILAEQLADEYMRQRFIEYMEGIISRAQNDIQRFENHPEKKQIAEFLLANFEKILDSYYHNYYGNILGSFKWLQDEGMIELITCGATHGFLPLFESDSGIFSQIQLAVDTHKKYFGKFPRGIWIPECAYRPKKGDREKFRESIDYWLNNSELEYFFVDSHGILDAEILDNKNDIGLNTNFGFNLESGVSVFGRNKNTSRQVWDAKIGYPGDNNYREFHKKDHDSGLHYWRITDKSTGKEDKQLYNIQAAQDKIKSHANHFISIMIDELKEFHIKYKQKGIIISPYDFELYGHWWMEGIGWLKKVFELINKVEEVEMLAIGDYVSAYRNQFSTIRMEESSWGVGGHFEVWKNPEHGWIWPYINGALKEFEQILKLNPNPNEDEERILKQIGRELLLMEGSDWPFLLYTEQAKEYANQRFHNHHQRFNKLMWIAKDFSDKKRLSMRELEEIESIDSCFPNLNINYFRRIN